MVAYAYYCVAVLMLMVLMKWITNYMLLESWNKECIAFKESNYTPAKQHIGQEGTEIQRIRLEI